MELGAAGQGTLFECPDSVSMLSYPSHRPSYALKPYQEIMRLRDALRLVVNIADLALDYAERGRPEQVLMLRSQLGKISRDFLK